VAEAEETVYPLDPAQRELVLEIERVARDLQRDVEELRARGAADDILQATCAKLLARAKESVTRRDTSADFATRHLEMTRNSLVTAYRQVRARVTRAGG
jgi:DNA-directed RNA polymerase specialized sigma24 family protein